MQTKDESAVTVRFKRQTALAFILAGITLALLGLVLAVLLTRKAPPAVAWLFPGLLFICPGLVSLVAGLRILVLNPIVLELRMDGLKCANERRFFPWAEVRGIRSMPGHLVLELTVPERRIERRCYAFTRAVGLVWLPEATEHEHILSTNGWDTDPRSVEASIRKILDQRSLTTR